MDVKVDSVGNIYVVDTNNKRVQVGCCTMPTRCQIDQPELPPRYWLSRPPAPGPPGNEAPGDFLSHEYIMAQNSDRALPCLQKFNSSFSYLSQFGSDGTGNGQVSGMRYRKLRCGSADCNNKAAKQQNAGR